MIIILVISRSTVGYLPRDKNVIPNSFLLTHIFYVLLQKKRISLIFNHLMRYSISYLSSFNFKSSFFCHFLKEKIYFKLYLLYFLPPIGFISSFFAILRTTFSNSAYTTSGKRVAISATELLG